MGRKYKKGTKLKYIGTIDTYESRDFEYGETYTLGYAKPYGYYSFVEQMRYKEYSKSFVENPDNFKLDSVPKWKKFIEKEKVF